MTEVSAKVIRIGPESRCSVFHKDGVVYATILGNAPRSRPSEACCEVKDTNKGMVVSDIQSNGGGVGQGVGGNLLSIFADGRNQGVVRSDKNKATRVDFMDPLLGQVVTGVLRKGGDKAPVSKCRHKRIATLYKITSPIGKAYVGQTMWPGARINRHKLAKHSKCTILVSAIKKYGWDNMHVEILRGGPKAIGGKVAEEELDSLEEHYIASLNTRAPNGYNIQKGGKVAWRGAAGLSRRQPRGPRPEHVKEKLRATWAAKREKRLQGVDPELARRKRHNAKNAKRLTKPRQIVRGQMESMDEMIDDGRRGKQSVRPSWLSCPPKRQRKGVQRWRAKGRSQCANTSISDVAAYPRKFLGKFVGCARGGTNRVSMLSHALKHRGFPGLVQ